MGTETPDVGFDSGTHTTVAPRADRVVEAGAVKLDEGGFSSPRALAWDEVLAVEAVGDRVVALTRSADGYCRATIDERVGREAAARMRSAWQDRVVERLAAGTPLAGGLVASFRWLPPLMWTLGGLMLVWAAVGCGVGIGVAENVSHMGDPTTGAIVAGAAVVCVTALTMATALFALALRYRRMIGIWKSWQFDINGLRPETPPGPCAVLRPIAADYVWPRGALIAGIPVPLGWMSAGAFVASVLMRCGRRSQATVARDSRGERILVPLLCALLWLATVAAHLAAPQYVAAQATVFAAACVATAAWMAELFASRRAFRRAYIDGRSLVERLGW